VGVTKDLVAGVAVQIIVESTAAANATGPPYVSVWRALRCPGMLRLSQPLVVDRRGRRQEEGLVDQTWRLSQLIQAIPHATIKAHGARMKKSEIVGIGGAPSNALMDRGPSVVGRSRWPNFPPTRSSPIEHTAIVKRRLVLLARLPIECSQRVHDIVESDRSTAARSDPQFRCCFDCADVGRPRGENCSLLIECQVSIADNIQRMRKCFGWVQKIVEIKCIANLSIGPLPCMI
jgi:hypothetical protein